VLDRTTAMLSPLRFEDVVTGVDLAASNTRNQTGLGVIRVGSDRRIEWILSESWTGGDSSPITIGPSPGQGPKR
jgi:hypothetical protein